MLRGLFLIIIAGLSFNFNCLAQNSNILAKFDNGVISEQDFIIRYELAPQLFRENKNIISELKIEFLYSIIAEKLLASYGEETRLDTSQIVKESLNYFQEMFVRDALYKEVITKKAKNSVDSLLSFYLNNASNVKMLYIFSAEQKEITGIYNLIKMGFKFDSLYAELNDGRRDTLTISIGQVDEEIEKQIFYLPDGGISEPVKMKDGWYLFKILARANPVLVKSVGWESDLKNIRSIAKERAEYNYFQSYKKNFFKNKELRMNAKLLKILSAKIFSIFNQRYGMDTSASSYYLKLNDILIIKDKLGKDSLSLSIAEINSKKYTVSDFLSSLKFDSFKVDTINNKYIFNKLGNKLREFVEYKLLAEEGYKMNLQKFPEVKEQLQMWKENYYAQLVTSGFIDSAKITDYELEQYLEKTNSGPVRKKEINIAKFYSDSLEIIEQVIGEIQNGKDFMDVARYFVQKGSNSQLFKTGYIRVSGNDPVSRYADNMKPGEIYGPIKDKDKYLVFKLLDVKEDSVAMTHDIKDLDEIKSELGYSKMNKSYNTFISNLATKYGLKVFLEKLNNVQVNSHQSIVYNYLGFGGRILAVPLLNINMEWVPEWKSKIDNLQ